ncbi:MAG: CopD family protein [Actinomycetota bacterium]|nr:CopD family protein [Actinomycetota bacterium]
MLALRSLPRAAALWALFASLLVAAIAAAPGARADATFEGSTPTNGETVVGPVTEIELVFSDPIGLNTAETRLLDAEGTELIYETVDDGNTWLIEPALSLDNGVYGLIWQAEAADGHTVRGVVRFGVGDVVLEDPEPTPQEGSFDNQLAVAEAQSGGSGGGFFASIGAGLANLGVIVGWGVALFVAFVTTARMTWVGKYLMQLMRIAGAIAMVGAVIELAAQLLGSGGGNLMVAAILRLAAGAALFAVPGMVNGSPFIWVLSGVVIVSYAIDGHTVTQGPLWLMLLADASHVTFAAIWGGGIIALAIALALVIRRRDERDVLVPDGSELAIRFSRFATYAVFGVSITGIVMAFFILPDVGSLVSSPWGILLLIKIALVATLAIRGARVHFGAIPEIEYAQVQREAGDDVHDLERSHLRDLRRSLMPSMVLVLAILIVSGLLVQASTTG